LSADEVDSSFYLDLVDELGCPVRSVFFDVHLVEQAQPRRRPRRLGGVADFADLPAAAPPRYAGADMTVDLAIEAEIRRLHYAEHWPIGTVAAQLSVHRDVVRRVLGLLEPRTPRPPRPLLLEPYRPFIDETLKKHPRLRATRMYDMLAARGFGGSLRTVREFVAQVRPRPPREAYLRVAPLMGEQAQVDWAHVGELDVPGGPSARCGSSSWSFRGRARSGASSYST
jgi:hypothetical protein